MYCWSMGKDNTPKSMADIVGMPDDQDKQNILIIIKKFEKSHPGELVHTIETARANFREQGFDVRKYGVVNESASGRTLFELPAGLVAEIERAYPLMFKDKKHFLWFIKNFKALLIPEKY